MRGSSAFGGYRNEKVNEESICIFCARHIVVWNDRNRCDSFSSKSPRNKQSILQNIDGQLNDWYCFRGCYHYSSRVWSLRIDFDKILNGKQSIFKPWAKHNKRRFCIVCDKIGKKIKEKTTIGTCTHLCCLSCWLCVICGVSVFDAHN